MAMSKATPPVVAFVAMLSVSALTSAPALGAPAEWMLNKKTLAEAGLTSAALKTTAKTDENDVLSGGGITITCSGNVEAKSPEIIKSNKIKATALIVTACTASPTACKVPTTIGTVPVEAELTLNGALGAKGVVKPQSGTVFTTLSVTGEEAGCAVAGCKAVTGDAEVVAPEGQDERTDQLLTVNQAASGLLKLGSSSASLKAAALLLLANSSAWSFL